MGGIQEWDVWAAPPNCVIKQGQSILSVFKSPKHQTDRLTSFQGCQNARPSRT